MAATMEIPLAVVADYANVAEGGKLNIMGVFDRMWCPAFPITHPQLSIVLKMEVDPAEYNSEKAMEIKLLDADGDQKWAMTWKVNIGMPPPGQRVHINQILNLQNTQFEKPGDYVFVVLVNGDPKARIPLKVEQAQGATP